MNRDRLFKIAAVAIVCLFAVLALYRLANAYFWDDEAYVGFMAANFLKSGHLSCWDGRNLYVAEDGALLHPDFTQSAQFSLDIASAVPMFKLFGVSTWAARFPSVLYATLGLVALTALLPFEFPKKPALVLFGLGLLAFSAQYLLNARTARYYSLVSLFAILTFYFYRRFGRSRSWPDAIGLSISAIVLFYGHLLGGLAFIVSLVVMHLVFHRRDYTKQDWTKIAVAAVLFLAATVPDVVVNQLWSYGRSGHESSGLRIHLWIAWLNLRDLNITNCLPWIAVVGLIVLLRKRPSPPTPSPIGMGEGPVDQVASVKRAEQVDIDDVRVVVRDWALLTVLYAIFQGLLCAPSQVSMQVSVLRYLGPILPFLTSLTAVFVWLVYRMSKPVAVGLFLVIISSNLLTLTPLPPTLAPATDMPRSLLPAYLHEITHPYLTSDEAVSKFLHANAQREDNVATYPSYHATTMDFYDGDFIRTGDLLDKQCPLPVDLIHSLHAPLYIDENWPNWVVFYGPETDQASTLKVFSQAHVENGKPVKYRYVLAKRLDVYWRETNRGELTRHEFVPPPVTDPKDAVYIYKRVQE